MSMNQFVRRLDRGLPDSASFAVLALAGLALTIYVAGSRAAGSEAAFVPFAAVPTSVQIDGNDILSPRECDLSIGIATDCLWLD